MWISRRKYNEMVKELEELRGIAEIFETHLTDMWEEDKEKVAQKILEFLKEEEETEEDIAYLKRIVESDNTTRTKICDEIGITFKTLRNVLEGKPVKPSTREKIRKYVFSKQGGSKNGLYAELD